MKRLSFWLGIICLLYVGIGLVAVLLPVDVWTYILDLFIERDTNTFYKVVPTDGANYNIFIFSAVGVALIAYGKLKFTVNKDNV